MSQTQSGILPEHCRAAAWIEANVEGEVGTLRATGKTFADKLAAFKAKFPDAHPGAVVVFGNGTWYTLSGGAGVKELKNFPGYGKGLALTTQFDVSIHILPPRHDVNFSVAQAVMEAFGDYIEVKKEIYGPRWVERRDPSGSVNDTKGLVGEETRRKVVVIKDGVDAGGSYVFMQRWEYGLRQLSRVGAHDQEMVIGRTKEASEETNGDERLETSHLTHVGLKGDGKGLKIIRQNLPYGTVSGTHGLYSCVYRTRLYSIGQQLLSTLDDTDGKRDAMLRFTKPVTGDYYLAPSPNKLMTLQALLTH